MESTSRGPDRINVTKKTRELVNRIDESKFFCLHDSIVSRSELFAFAMAIGADTVPTKLENLYPGGLVLEKSIDSRTISLMYALFIGNLSGGDIDEISKKDAVYSMAQEYANTGFEVIEDYMDRKKDIDLLWDLLEELDSQFQIEIGA